MDETVATVFTEPPPPERDRFSTAVCRALAAGLIALVTAVNIVYLFVNCPIDLSGDEAQYWDWSRRLDYSYYSKGPAVALIIRAGTAVFGETMQGVRMPAVVLFAVLLAGVYVLTATLFRNEKLALGATGLMCLSPIMIYLSAAMTIDTPMIACWTWASVFAAVALFRGKRWAWFFAGGAIGLGFLAKYSALLWFVGLMMFFIWQRVGLRAWLHGLIAAVVAAVFSIPVIVWNHQHGWVGARHVARQTGAEGGSFRLLGALEMLGGQIGVVGPTIVVMIVGAVAWIVKNRAEGLVPRNREATATGRPPVPTASFVPPFNCAACRFLLSIGAPFFLLTFVASFFAKVQPNWPAPAYVTLIILAAAFIAHVRRTAAWKIWRGVVIATVVIGLGAHLIMRDTSTLVRAARWVRLNDATAARLDALSSLRGWEELGVRVGEEQQSLGPDAMILCDHYQQTALMAFYVPGRPRTFHAGAYFASPQRMNQYNLWADMDLSRPELRGRNAIYLGKGGPLPEPLPAAFARTEKLAEVPVVVHGVTVETFKLWRLYGFKGLERPATGHKY